MRKIRQLFKASILRTLFGSFLLVIIPTIIMNQILNYVGMIILRDNTTSSYVRSIDLISQQFYTNLNYIDTAASSIFIDDELIGLAGVPYSKNALYDYMQLQRRLALQTYPMFVSANISIILPKQGWVISTKYGVESFQYYASLQDFIRLSKDQPMWAIRPSLRAPDTNCFSIIRGFNLEPKYTSLLVSIEIDENEITRQLSGLFESSNVLSAYIIDPKGTIFVSGKKDIVDEGMKKAILSIQADSGASKEFTYKTGRQYRVVFSNSESNNCIIGVVFDEAEILHPIYIIQTIQIGILALSLIASLYFLIISYRRFFSPVNRIMDAMKQVADGDFEARAWVSDNADLGNMARQFNDMVRQLDRLLKEKYITQIKLKKAQLNFLQSQINPHFLYNSLFCLYSMIKNDDLDNAAEMAIYLGNYFQMSSHFNAKDITIADEIENIKVYMNIHELRFPGKLRFSADVEQGLERVPIPVLSLQTIVENAVTHAFRNVIENAFIFCRAARRDGSLVISIEDNGTGIGETELEQTRRQLENPEESEDTHGLQNVYIRMKMLHGDSVRMRLENREPRGTRVEIVIPM